MEYEPIQHTTWWFKQYEPIFINGGVIDGV